MGAINTLQRFRVKKMADDNEQWSKEEYTKHLANKQKAELEELKKKNPHQYKEISSGHKGQKRNETRTAALIVLVALVFYVGGNFFELVKAFGLSWPKSQNETPNESYDPTPYLRSLIAPAREDPARVIKSVPVWKIHVLTELSYPDDNSLRGIAKRISTLTPISVEFTTEEDANIFVASSSDIKNLTKVYDRELNKFFSDHNGIPAIQPLLFDRETVHCGGISILEPTEKPLAVGGLVFWDDALYDDQTSKCIAGALAGIAGLRGLVEDGDTVRNVETKPAYLTEIDIDLLNRIYRAEVTSGSELSAAMVHLLD